MRKLIFALALISGLGVAAFAGLTDQDNTWLSNHNVSRPSLTDTQAQHLHVLINAKGVSDGQKLNNVNSYVTQVSLDNIWQLAGGSNAG